MKRIKQHVARCVALDRSSLHRAPANRRLYFGLLLGTFLIAALPGAAAAQFIGPLPYVQFSDSPFAPGGYEYFYLEDFEDNLFDTPGVVASEGAILVPQGTTDSVDGDDGLVDGWGKAGHSFYNTSGIVGITLTFDETVLGNLPTDVGVVWTDGAGEITFEAFDHLGNSLGVVLGNHADLSFNGTTGEDRFYGVVNASGISAVWISNVSSAIEIDHIQYGYQGSVPIEGTTWGCVKAMFLGW